MYLQSYDFSFWFSSELGRSGKSHVLILVTAALEPFFYLIKTITSVSVINVVNVDLLQWSEFLRHVQRLMGIVKNCTASKSYEITSGR